MSRRPVQAALACVCWLAAATASAAVIEGRVVHPRDPAAAAGIDVALLGVNREGDTYERNVRTDPEGHFRLANLPAPAAYLIAALYDGLRFSGGSVVFEEGNAADVRSVVIHLFERSDDPAPLAIRSLLWVLEREAGAYRVFQRIAVDNPTDRVIAVDESAPAALRVGLLPGHAALQSPFAFGGLPEGVRAQGDMLELRGPFFPGEREVHLSYDVAAGSSAGPLHFTLVLPNAVEQLDLRVRDFGVAVDVGDLHPARPGRDGDEIYLRYLGFDLDPGSIPIVLEPLASPASLPLPAQAVLVALAAGALLFLTLRPLDSGAGEAVDAGPGTGGEAGRAGVEAAGQSAEGEREALFEALRDLEHDFETGKLSVEDRESLRAELRGEALRQLAAGRPSGVESTPTPGPEESVPSVCECGHTPATGDRFCAGCGKAL